MQTTGIQRNTVPIGNNIDRKKVKKIYSKKKYLSFFTFVLIVCLILAARSLILNIAKYITLDRQLHKLESLNSAAEKSNKNLQKELRSYTTFKGIEALARDNMKMAAKDEVLVIIKQPQNSQLKVKK